MVLMQIGLGCGLIMMSVGYFTIAAQNQEVDLQGWETTLNFFVVLPSAVGFFFCFWLFGIIPLWVNFLINSMAGTKQGDHLRERFSPIIFAKSEDSKDGL